MPPSRRNVRHLLLRSRRRRGFLELGKPGSAVNRSRERCHTHEEEPHDPRRLCLAPEFVRAGAWAGEDQRPPRRAAPARAGSGRWVHSSVDGLGIDRPGVDSKRLGPPTVNFVVTGSVRVEEPEVRDPVVEMASTGTVRALPGSTCRQCDLDRAHGPTSLLRDGGTGAGIDVDASTVSGTPPGVTPAPTRFPRREPGAPGGGRRRGARREQRAGPSRGSGPGWLPSPVGP